MTHTKKNERDLTIAGSIANLMAELQRSAERADVAYLAVTFGKENQTYPNQTILINAATPDAESDLREYMAHGGWPIAIYEVEGRAVGLRQFRFNDEAWNQQVDELIEQLMPELEHKLAQKLFGRVVQ